MNNIIQPIADGGIEIALIQKTGQLKGQVKGINVAGLKIRVLKIRGLKARLLKV